MTTNELNVVVTPFAGALSQTEDVLRDVLLAPNEGLSGLARHACCARCPGGFTRAGVLGWCSW